VPPKHRSPIFLLLLGCAVGIAVAAVGLLRSNESGAGLPADAIARVNGQVIRRDDFLRILNGVAQDRREGLSPEIGNRVLDRLIDEELLVQRGIELGLARYDTRVRKDLTAAVIESVVADAGDVQPTEAELQSFYRAHQDFFTSPGRVRVRQIWCRAATVAEASGAFERAQQATQRLRAGEDFDSVRSGLADSELAAVPDTMLPLSKLADYLGPTALRTLQGLEPGQVSDPVRSTSGYHVLQLVERQSDAPRSLADIRPQVVQEFRRNTADRALRAYVEDLRSRAQVETAALPE